MAIGASALVSTGVVLAGKQAKVSVCHYDRTLGAYVVLNVAEPSRHLAHGDTLADGRLIGKTVYAWAYTERDGATGYSACGDTLIAALIEANDDRVPSSGDTVVLGTYPTAFAAPYGFTAFPSATATVTGVSSCSTVGVAVSAGIGVDALWGTGAGGTFAYGDYNTNVELANSVVLQDNVGGGSAVQFTDRIFAFGSVNTKAHEGDNAWLEVVVAGVCSA